MGMVAFRREGAERWLGKEYLEKDIFGHALMVACFELEYDTKDAFTYFLIDLTPRMHQRIKDFGKSAHGLSTPILFDIRTHLYIRRETATSLPEPPNHANSKADKQWWQFWK